ncbi:MAG: hypothetical protein ACLSVD_06800 [Eggerthellaceae bacterium]
MDRSTTPKPTRARTSWRICRKYGLAVRRLVNVFPTPTGRRPTAPASFSAARRGTWPAPGSWYDEMGGGAAPSPAPSPPRPSASRSALPRPHRNGVLPEMVDHTDTGGSGDDYAGDGSPILHLAIDMPGWYQSAHAASRLATARQVRHQRPEDGCAGDGSPITAGRCYYEIAGSRRDRVARISTRWLTSERASWLV